MNLKTFLRDRKRAHNPAKINLRNAWAVLQALFRKKQMQMSGMGIDQHLWEQIIYARIMVQKNSPQCWKSGACIECGCEILGKTMEDRACEKDCYPVKMSKEDWEEYKTIHNIKFFD